MEAQLETEQTNDDNINILKAIKNCTIIDNMDFEKTCDVRIAPDIPDNNICRGESTDISKRPTVERCAIGQKESGGKLLRFAQDAKDTENKPLKRQLKQYDYPIISIPDVL